MSLKRPVVLKSDVKQWFTTTTTTTLEMFWIIIIIYDELLFNIYACVVFQVIPRL